ncbi:MAG: dihydrofolate reductase family protein [Myxococcota bacterium]
MRELAILTFTSLDGVMQAPRLPEGDPAGGFRGGWAAPYWEEVMPHVAKHAMASPYDLLLGRRTYDLFFAHQGSDPSSPMSAATKFVVTSSPNTLRWANSVALTGDVESEVTRLKNQDGPLLQVHGSWKLIQALLAHDLVDEFRIWTFPVLVGSGKRLFSAERLPPRLRLRATEAVGVSGVVMQIYRRH